MSVYDRTEMWGYLLGDWKDFSLVVGYGFNKRSAEFRASPDKVRRKNTTTVMVVVQEKAWRDHGTYGKR